MGGGGGGGGGDKPLNARNSLVTTKLSLILAAAINTIENTR